MGGVRSPCFPLVDFPQRPGQLFLRAPRSQAGPGASPNLAARSSPAPGMPLEQLPYCAALPRDLGLDLACSKSPAADHLLIE